MCWIWGQAERKLGSRFVGCVILYSLQGQKAGDMELIIIIIIIAAAIFGTWAMLDG